MTGSHNMKVGYQGSLLINETSRVRNDTLLAYRFNQGVPNQVSVAIPDWLTADTTSVACVLRAGRVDAQPDDAAGRAALRPCLELEPGR